MNRGWYQISHTSERWTAATWILFVTLLGSFSFLFLHVTGFFDVWLEFLTVAGKATIEVAEADPSRGHENGSPTGFMIVMIGYSFVVPVVMAMLPTATAQWWILRRFGRKPIRRRRTLRRAGIVLSHRGG